DGLWRGTADQALPVRPAGEGALRRQDRRALYERGQGGAGSLREEPRLRSAASRRGVPRDDVVSGCWPGACLGSRMDAPGQGTGASFHWLRERESSRAGENEAPEIAAAARQA